jgi:hypothetical protein
MQPLYRPSSFVIQMLSAWALFAALSAANPNIAPPQDVLVLIALAMTAALGGLLPIGGLGIPPATRHVWLQSCGLWASTTAAICALAATSGSGYETLAHAGPMAGLIGFICLLVAGGGQRQRGTHHSCSR